MSSENHRRSGSPDRRSRTNAVVGWAATGTIALTAVATLYAGPVLWGLFSAAATVAIALPALTTRDWTAIVPWPLTVTAAAAAAVRAAGAYADPAGSVAIAVFGLVVAAELEAFTPVELTRRFTVAFGVMAGLALESAWIVAQFASDRWFETSFLQTQTELQQDIVAATATAFAAGAVYYGYLAVAGRDGSENRAPAGGDTWRDDPAGDGAASDGEAGTGATGDDADGDAKTLGDALGLSDAHERLLVRVLQLGLVGLFVYGVAVVHPGIIASGLVGLLVTALPALLRREYGYVMDAGLVLWIALSMVLHVVGYLGLYDQFQWYDEVTHTVSGTIIAGLGYAAFRAVELHTADVDAPASFRGVFVVVFVAAAGMVWEVFEHAFGTFVTVYGVEDIVTDLAFNAVGGAVVALWGTGYASGVVGFLRDRLRSRDES